MSTEKTKILLEKDKKIEILQKKKMRSKKHLTRFLMKT